MIIGDVETFDQKNKLQMDSKIQFSRNWSKINIFKFKYFKRFRCHYSKKIIKYNLLQNKKTSLQRGDISAVVNVISKNIFFPITNILNFCLQQGIALNSLIIESITSIFKKLEEQSLTNYRAILVLLSFSMTLERIMDKRLHT